MCFQNRMKLTFKVGRGTYYKLVTLYISCKHYCIHLVQTWHSMYTIHTKMTLCKCRTKLTVYISYKEDYIMYVLYKHHCVHFVQTSFRTNINVYISYNDDIVYSLYKDALRTFRTNIIVYISYTHPWVYCVQYAHFVQKW